jgi:hypothetical protein
MPRPKKNPRLLKDEMLRIPVSAKEKNLINEAAVAMDGEFARWARAILLKVAISYQANRKAGKSAKRGSEARERVGAVALE